MGDQDHIIKLKQNDATSFRYLYDKYCGLIFYISTHMGLQKEASEEIVQETFLKIWEKRNELDETLSLKSYLIAIAKNLILKTVRNKMYDIAYHQYYEKIADTSSSETENEILFGDMLRNTEKFIDKLPEVQKQIFLLHQKSHLSANKIADELNLSCRTVENQLYRANKKIMEYIRNQKLISIILCTSLNIFFRW
jgi:RNA polymerase sigma-70 factor (family 1)